MVENDSTVALKALKMVERDSKARESATTSSSDSDEDIRRKTTKGRPVPLKMSAPSLTGKFTSPHETPSTSNLAVPHPQSSNESLIGKSVKGLGILHIHQ